MKSEAVLSAPKTSSLRIRIFSKEFQVSIFIILILLVIYSFLRAGFYFSNYTEFSGLSRSEILYSFLRGIRFDLSAIFIINLPVLFLYNLPVKMNWKWYRRFTSVLFLIINFAALTLNIADYSRYPVIGRRLLYEPYTMLPDIARMFPSLISYHWVLFIVLLISMILFFVLFRFFFRWINSKITEDKSNTLRIISFVILVLVSITAVRGGFQMKPLRTANAFDSENLSAAYLTLNSTYTVARSFFQPVLPVFNMMSNTEASERVQSFLRTPEEELLDPEYPFLRKLSPLTPEKKKNVVIFIMESWSAPLCGSISGKKSFTPFFDSLASQGILFTNFFASGQRSIEAVPAILASVPAIYDASIIGSVSESFRFRGLGSILTEHGYTTSFHHGAATGSMGFDAFSKIAGFMNYYGKESISISGDTVNDGAWGIYDEPFFLESGKVISGFTEPFCSVIFSLSSHDPYSIPPNRKQIFEKYNEESDFEISVRYSDFSLESFFHAAEKEPWFTNTIFIVTGDHTNFADRNSFTSTFNVPFLIYSPGNSEPERINRVSSHTDILSTVLEMLSIRAVHSSMGSSALIKGSDKYAFLKYGSGYVIVSGKYALVNDLENQPGLYDYHADPHLKFNLFGLHKTEADALNLNLSAYIQISTHSIAEDRVYRPVE